MGRPTKPLEERKAQALSFRARPALREQLKTSSANSGRSLSEEVESRLEASFSHASYVRAEFGDDVFRIAQASARALSQIEDVLGVTWTDDDKATDVFQRTVVEIIRNYRDQVKRALGRGTPHGSFDDKSPEELAQMFAALGGLPPPRVKRKPVDIELHDADAIEPSS